MTYSRMTFRALSSQFGQMARSIQMIDGSIQLTVNQKRLAKVATSPCYCYCRPHQTHGEWILRHQLSETAIGQIPQHLTEDLETLVTNLVPDYGWLEVSIQDFRVTSYLIHVPQEHPVTLRPANWTEQPQVAVRGRKAVKGAYRSRSKRRRETKET